MPIVINELETELLEPETPDAELGATEDDIDAASADLPQRLASAVALLHERQARLRDD